MPVQGEGPDVSEDTYVPFRIIADRLGWSVNTARKYLLPVRHRLDTRPVKRSGSEDEDRRGRLYPLNQTMEAIRKQRTKVETRRERSHNDAAAYWLALAKSRLSVHQLRMLARKSTALANEIEATFRQLRQHPPRSNGFIYTLPGDHLELIEKPLVVVVSPLRGNLWRVTLPELDGVHGDGDSHDTAVLHFREELSNLYCRLRDAQHEAPQLWSTLRQLISQRISPEAISEIHPTPVGPQ